MNNDNGAAKTAFVQRRVAKVFEDQGIRITVMKSNHLPYGRFGFCVETVRQKSEDEGGGSYTIPYINPRVHGQKICATEVDATIDVVKDLLDEVKEWIVENAQEDAEAVRSERERYELKDADAGKPETRQTGKTEKAKNKKKRIAEDFKAA